jgi:hypothetical protein
MDARSDHQLVWGRMGNAGTTNLTSCLLFRALALPGIYLFSDGSLLSFRPAKRFHDLAGFIMKVIAGFAFFCLSFLSAMYELGSSLKDRVPFFEAGLTTSSPFKSYVCY